MNKRLPKNWNEKRISDIANISVGKDVKESSFSKERTNTHKYPVFSNTVDNFGLYGYYNFPEYHKDGLTIVGRGAGLGTAFPRKGGFGAIGRLLVLSPKDHEFDPRYLSEFINNRFRLFNESGGIPQLPGITLGKYKVVLPPLPEQRAIADILSTWDTAIEKMETLIEAKEKRFRGLLKEIIENPNNKEINTKLGAICVAKKGKQLNKDHMVNNGKYYVLNGGIVPSGRTNDWNTEANTITISEGGNSCGFVSLNCERFWSGGHCYALEGLKDNIYVDYLYYYLKYFEPKIMRLRVGSGLPNIQKKDINKFQLNFPKLEEQINDALKLKLANNEIEILKEVLKKYKEQKRGLMQKLLTGEWRVKV
jgi:type I restriction enzyme S subunit